MELGYLGCSLEAAMGKRGVPRRVAITFDDGTRGQFDQAAPALTARGMTATFFVTTDWVGSPGFMTWDQLRGLKSMGMSVQSHTKSHPFLSELGAAELRDELAASKRELDAELRQDTQQMAFPGGNAPHRRLRPILAEVGYRVVAGSRWGVNDDDQGARRAPWVRRCTAPRDASREFVARILRGDRRLRLARGLRETVLYGMRGLLGASRYARIRRGVLDAMVRRASPE